MKSSAPHIGGSQEPRIRIEPQRAYTDGDNAAILISAYAFDLDPWQRAILDCLLGRREDGRLTTLSCGISVPRQNGKNASIEALEFFLLLNVPDTHILHTAHQVRTSKRAFNRLAKFFSDKRHPELLEEVECIRRTNGEERIELVNGNTIEYSARSRSAARGFDAITLVIYDEAQELTDDQVEAIMSTLAASPTGDRQIVYAGTPPPPTSPGEVFGRVRKATIDHPAADSAWFEWSVEEIPKARTFEEVAPLVEATNPAMGRRLSMEFTQKEFDTFSPDGFARERLGYWEDVTAEKALVSKAAWAACETDEPPARGKQTFGVKFSPDGSTVDVVAALMPKGGKPYVELVHHTDISKIGVQWLAEWIAERADKVALTAIDGRSCCDALVERLQALGVKKRAYTRVRTGDAIAAASMFVNAVKEGGVEHFGQTQLTDSVTKASRRTIGTNGGFGFGGDDPFPAEAATLAFWAVKTTKRDPSRKTVLS